MSKSKFQSKRYQFLFQNQLIYEWQQSLESITLYIPAPNIPNVKPSKLFDIKITAKNLQVGIKGNPPYLRHQFEGVIDQQQSLWFMQDRENNSYNNNSKMQKQTEALTKQIIVQLHKAQKGVLWGCVFKDHKNLNPLQQEELKKKLMLERFQQENPNFDFSQAQFNGKVPEARNFMGGVKYS